MARIFKKNKMKKQLFTLALGVASLGAFSQTPSTIWQSYNSNAAANTYIQHLSVVDTNTVWGLDGNQYNMFTRTTDGANYHAGMFNTDTNTYNIAGISAVSANTAYIACFNKAQNAGNQGQILQTTNGGNSWTNMVSTGMYTGSTVAFIDWVHFWDANNGIVFGDPNGHSVPTSTVTMWEIYRTHNGGTTWTRVPDANLPAPLNLDGGLTSSYTTWKHFIWAGTFNGLVLASADSGKTWTYPNTTTIGLDGGCNGVAFRDSIHGLAWGSATSGGAPATVRTADGGVTWTPVTMTTSVGVNAISTIPKTKGYMSVGLDSTLTTLITSVTYDDGATWNVLETAPNTATNNPKRMISLQMVDSLNGWAGNFSDTSNIYAQGKGGMNRFHLGHKKGCPIGMTSITTSSPFNVCQGNSITLNASGLNTYTWSTSATTASVSVSPTVTTSYSVAGTTTAGCSNYDVVNVTVVTGTVTTVSTHTVCGGVNTTLHAAGATTYSWSPSTALTATTGTVSVASPTASITYTVTGTKNSCPITPATIAFTIKPTPNVSISTNTTSIACGTTATLTANGATSYNWSATASSATTAAVAVTPTVTTSYSVSGTNTVNTCIGTASFTLTVTGACSGIENYSNNAGVSVYPNPSNGLVTLTLSNLDAGTALYVTNMIGQEVVKATVKDLTTNFDFSHLQKGVYFITVTNGKNKHVEKLIIQ